MLGENSRGNTLELGLDIGSMTVKAVVLSPENHILLSSYRRHNSRQAETLRDVLTEIKETYPDTPMYVSITGSGARSLKAYLHAEYIQEVNALTLAVEMLVPEARSAIELGGQDAKVIIWKGDGERKTTLSYMNDKCAGGTGSTIDKIMAKIGISSEEAEKIMPEGRQIHRIAAKCGVFAETDVVGLLKSGIPREEIFISLCNAIVKQNLEVLVHGNVLPEKVVLLGGPNTFIPAFAHVWREQIKAAWDMHGYTPREANLEKSIIVPALPHFFAAIGAVLFTREGREDTQQRDAHLIDPACLDAYIAGGAAKETAELQESIYNSIKNTEQIVLPPLVSSQEELEAFRKKYAVPAFTPPVFQSGDTLEVFIGIDGGSTSTKIVALDKDGTLLYRDYILSQGNPLEDAQYLFKRMQEWRDKQKIIVKVLGAGVTGYAQDILKAALNIDVAVVETVAHMKSAAALYGEVDVICDVGGQDIKVLFMKNRRVVDFKLNTQCSAGNGYFLQSMAAQFNIPVEEYEDYAFRAARAPKFNYGCAVFMEQDRVMFQQSGWTKEEMMCGLAHVLPINIWTYVVQENNLSRLGKRFVLQGGTQKNLAAVKAQVDYIKRKVPGAEVFVHTYADISGAIGAALEVISRKTANSMDAGESAFIGIEAAALLRFTSKNDETTRCSGCANKCRRTFVDIEIQGRFVRFISGYLCEKGAADDKAQVQNETKRLQKIRSENPDITLEAANRAFSDFDFEPPPESAVKAQAAKKRASLTVGIPRLLNMFYYAPFWSTYFRTLGLTVVTSDFTNERLWSEGNKWGAIDPCFPAKAAPAHIWQLLNHKDKNGKSLDAIFFPVITDLGTDVQNTLGNTACVIQMGTAEVVKAVFTRDRNMFAEKNIAYWEPVVNLDRKIEGQTQTFEYFKDPLHITKEENAWAFTQGLHAMAAYLQVQRERFAAIMNRLIDEDKIGLLLVGHPYHHDPGLNHGIPQELQKRGYPIFTIESLPLDKEFLEPLFMEDMAGDIGDVWARCFNRNTNQKTWACKIAARHPNLGVIDLSSFKCGHDAPTYSYIDSILEASGTPHFNFHDLDQNRPGATFKIRIDTIDYFLQEYEHNLKKGITNGTYKSA
ncbi:hypothetical protein FACS1894109_16190 [Spirochaetia bacterium]|nr:hypothetical protein FACS1894109_16190 [Spirochaetia bacterium]